MMFDSILNGVREMLAEYRVEIVELKSTLKETNVLLKDVAGNIKSLVGELKKQNSATCENCTCTGK